MTFLGGFYGEMVSCMPRLCVKNVRVRLKQVEEAYLLAKHNSLAEKKEQLKWLIRISTDNLNITTRRQIKVSYGIYFRGEWKHERYLGSACEIIASTAATYHSADWVLTTRLIPLVNHEMTSR